MSRPVCVAVVLTALMLLPVSVAQAQAPPLLTRSAAQGFGDPANRMSWSMAWFKGKLYVGTSRENSCVELATVAFYNLGDYYSAQPGPDVSCPADRYNLRLQAEIWQLTPSTGVWRRVFQSPQDIPNPRAPGKFVARDIGFRGMVVHRGSDGTEALYVGGVTANEYIPEIAAAHPPRMLRSTDGESFTPLAGVPTTITTLYGRQHPVGFRAMTVYKGRLFVTSTAGLLGDGVVMEVKKPSGSAPAFEQVTPPELRVFELDVFNGHLFIGAGDLDKGYSLYRTDAHGPTPAMTPIITLGGGRGPAMTSVVSMHVFKNRLYVGANGFASLLPQSELVRVNPDDTWDLVTGQPRFTNDSLKFPLTGLPDGFGNYFTSHFWRQVTHNGTLYIGTLDSSWGLRVIPFLDAFLRPEMGFDLYGTCDGQFWWRVTRDAFGDGRHNLGARTLVSTPFGGYIGSYNSAEGTSVWRSTDPSPCGEPSARERQARRAPWAPRKLLADVQRGGTVLSWGRSAGATRYRIMRAGYRVARSVKLPAGPRRRAFVPDTPPPLTVWNGRTRTDLSAAGPFVAIGATRKRVFVDRTARRRARYLYRVVAIRGGRRSPPSNTVLVPSKRPRVTFAEAEASLRRLAPGPRAALARELAAAQRLWAQTDRGRSLRRLVRFSRAAAAQARTSSVADRVTQEDARDTVMRLARRLRYAGIAGG